METLDIIESVVKSDLIFEALDDAYQIAFNEAYDGKDYTRILAVKKKYEKIKEKAYNNPEEIVSSVIVYINAHNMREDISGLSKEELEQLCYAILVRIFLSKFGCEEYEDSRLVEVMTGEV